MAVQIGDTPDNIINWLEKNILKKNLTPNDRNKFREYIQDSISEMVKDRFKVEIKKLDRKGKFDE